MEALLEICEQAAIPGSSTAGDNGVGICMALQSMLRWRCRVDQ